MLNFRSYKTVPPAFAGGNSPFAPGPAQGKRVRPASDFDLVVLGALVLGAAVVGFAQKNSPGPQVAAPTADQVDAQIVERDEPLIWDVLVRYGRDHGGRIPAFDSRRLPNWWTSYSRHPMFDYRYVMKGRFVDAPIARFVDWDPASLLRPVVSIGPDGRARPVLRITEPPNSSA